MNMHAVTSLYIIYSIFNDLYKLIETYIYAKKVIPQQSTQNTAYLPLQTCKKTVPLHGTGVDFSSRNNFANLGSFAKFPFLWNL